MKYLLVCLIVITLASVGLAYDNRCQKDRKFDIALLSITWAPGLCAANTKPCVEHGNDFLIHGMWPNFMNNSYPANCCFQQTLHKNVLTPIMDRLEKNWRSVYSKDAWSFWVHEWKKHGTCAQFSAFVGQLNYFTKTLDLFEKVDLSGWLEKGGIKPSENGVALQLVREAVRKGFTKRPQVICNGKSVSAGLPLIVEIRLCYNPNTLAPMDCPVESDTRCRSKTGQVVYIGV